MEWVLLIMITTLEAQTHNALPMPSQQACTFVMRNMDVQVHNRIALPKLEKPVDVGVACMSKEAYDAVVRKPLAAAG